MPFPLLGLLPGILRTVASITGLAPVKEAADVLQNAQIPPEKQAELQEALLRHQEAMKALSIDEMKTAVSESLTLIASPDKFVSRARPTGLYIFYGVSAAIAVGMLFGVHIDPTAVLTILAPLGGVGATYVYQRTREKLNGQVNE